MRTMKLEINGDLLYESFFDPKNGNTIRRVAETQEWFSMGDGYGYQKNLISHKTSQILRKMYPNRFSSVDDYICSPSPEIVDISITNMCNMNCEYCYTNSGPELEHGRDDLVSTILSGFKTVPYQIALGGGEPTLHPNFPQILKEAHELGTVPNYTTNGSFLSDDVIKATNDFCGGVAMTYHTFKGFSWFQKKYKNLRSSLNCQVNVHLIADRYVVKSLENLIELQEEMGRPINLVLLAYDPNIGRAKFNRTMTRTIYTKELPEVLKKALKNEMRIAYSEGLSSYFLSRPEIGINTEFSTIAEGHFSCYFDSRGRIHKSSFSEVGHKNNCFEVSSQKLWNELHSYDYSVLGENCSDCPHKDKCSISSSHLYNICARAHHNQLPLESLKKV